MTVNSGDLLHADRHGAVVIPHHVASRVVDTCQAIMRDEAVIIRLCQSPDFSIEALDRLISPDY